jgi:hypothetical protein
VRQFIRPAKDGTAATNDPLNNRTFAFIGDCFPPQLPAIKMEPSTGLVDYGQPTVLPVPDDAPLEAFYQRHGDEELAPRRTTSTQQEVRRVIYLPMAWVPSFIDDIPPKEAWERARALRGLMQLADQALFQPLVDWAKAACQKSGGAAQGTNNSQLSVPWRDVRANQRFIGWATGHGSTDELLPWHLSNRRGSTRAGRKPICGFLRGRTYPSHSTRHVHRHGGHGGHGARPGSSCAPPDRLNRRIMDAPPTSGDL